MMLVPEAYKNQPALDDKPEITAFYDYYSGLQEAWDGPALLVYTCRCVYVFIDIDIHTYRYMDIYTHTTTPPLLTAGHRGATISASANTLRACTVVSPVPSAPDPPPQAPRPSA